MLTFSLSAFILILMSNIVQLSATAFGNDFWIFTATNTEVSVVMYGLMFRSVMEKSKKTTAIGQICKLQAVGINCEAVQNL